MAGKFDSGKRPAPSDSTQKSKFSKTSNGYAGPKRDKPSYPTKKGSAPSRFPTKSTYDVKPKAEKPEEVKRRKRPVTQGGGEEEENDEMDVDEEEEDGGDGEADAIEKKPRMSKTERAALHAAQPHRTALLPSHPLLQDTLLPLWEVARRADLGKEERTKAVRELYEAVKGRIGEVSRGHKGGRVLQTIVKYGGKEERLGVAMELKPYWRDMMESKYSKFLMSKLIRYCPSIRPLLIESLGHHIPTLISHAHAVQPLSDFFDFWANKNERRMLVRGFYPKEVRIFDGLKETKGKEISKVPETGTLADALVAMGDGKGRERVLDGIEKTVLDVFNATQKNALAQSIFHYLVREYLTCVHQFLTPEEREKKINALMTDALESLPEIVHTKDGSAVIRDLIARGNAKDRKQILSVLRKHVEAMCKDSDAQMVLFTAFDCVDDTKFVHKSIIADILASASTLAVDKNGRRALFYLLTPTSTRHYIDAVLTDLARSAQLARDLGTSKKDPVVRRKELLSYASEGLLQLVSVKGGELVRDPGAGLLVQEIMLGTEGDKSKAISSLTAILATPYPDDLPSSPEASHEPIHPLDLPHCTRTYKTLLCGGRFNTSTQTLEISDPNLSSQFSQSFWEAITSEDAGGEENAVRVVKGNATFVMVEMIEGLVKAGKGVEVKEVLGKKEVIDSVRSGDRKGAGLLADRLEAL